MAAISGVAFSLTMVLLQLGFLEAVKITASNNFDQVDFDVVLLSPRYEQFYAPGAFPLERLTEARSVADRGLRVAHVRDLQPVAMPGLPRGPERGVNDGERALARPAHAVDARRRVPRPLQRRELFVIGIDLDKNPFREPIRSRIEAAKRVLRLPGRVLLNEQSHPDFGWQLRDQFNDWELGNHAVTVVGGFPMLRGFAADSTVICDDRNFASLCGFPRDRVSFGFLKVQAGSVASSVQALKAVLPADVEVFSRAEILSREIDHWVNQTSTGQLFAFGVLVAMIVATVVVYQVLSNDVREHLPEYATLKAMGYSPARLSRVVVEQSLIYMMIAYVIAVLLAIVVYWATQALAGIPMRLTPGNLLITAASRGRRGIPVGLPVPVQAAGRPARGPVLRRCGTMDDPSADANRTRPRLPRAVIPLAWRNLTENKRRLLASVAGTAFAVTLMFMENGFRHAMLDSMVNVIERLDGQIVILNRTLYTLAVPYQFPYRRLIQAREVPEVVGGQPGLRGDPVRLLARSARRVAGPDLRDRCPARGRGAGPAAR